MKNVEIRMALFEANMKQWELAELLGITEFTLSRKLRKELSDEEKNKIKQLITNQQVAKVM